MMERSLAGLAVAIGAITCASVFAGPDSFQRSGSIQNDRGERCTYMQRIDRSSTYFHGTLEGEIGIITFDDPNCMSAADVGLDVNKMMINNVISRWYSHSDANFRTRVSELFPGSLLQQRGKCIQSARYPIVGITIDYEVVDDSIVRVRHGQAIQGCKR